MSPAPPCRAAQRRVSHFRACVTKAATNLVMSLVISDVTESKLIVVIVDLL